VRVRWLQHVEFETLGTIEEWALRREHVVAATRLWAGDPLPEADSFDWLVVMGGPMNVYQEDTYAWLAPEKALIQAAVDAEKTVVGVCLGAQLVADVLGGSITRNEHTEIGWFPVTLTAAALESEAFGRLPAEFTALHWHGDTFSLPPGATHMAESAACVNQAFQWGSRTFGLQFHLECTREELEDLAREEGDDLVEGEWIQPAEELLGHEGDLRRSSELMFALLDGIQASAACG
jgi:GMP synthase (glutamine-hydrolysing)